MTDPKIANFDLIQTPYKKVGPHEIRTDILIPKAAPTGPRPIILRYHGGGLVMGDSLFMPFFPHWLSDLATKHNAIIVSPNYRLLPQATSPEIYADIEDFWTWLHSSEFRTILSSHSVPTEADLTRILTVGDSAGGLLSIYTALSHPRLIRAAMASYPMIEPGAFSSPRVNPPFAHSTPESVYEEYMATADSETGGVKSSWCVPESMTFMLAAAEYGHLSGLYERGTEGVDRGTLYPFVKLDSEGVEFPKGGIAVIHGRQDSVVPVGDVEGFVEKAKGLGLEGPGVTLTVRDGEHGFDGDLRFDEEEWMREAFRGVVGAWLE
jgi:acetyl esterase/lipase